MLQIKTVVSINSAHWVLYMTCNCKVLRLACVSTRIECRPTLRNVDGERAPGNLLACERDVDGVRPLQNGAVGATEDAVPLVLQHDLHRVPPAVRVHDDHTHIPSTSAWVTERDLSVLLRFLFIKYFSIKDSSQFSYTFKRHIRYTQDI